MTIEAKVDASHAICERLKAIASIELADTIFAYLSLDDEVNLTPLLTDWISESRTVGVPLVAWEENTMRAGVLPSLEPDSLVETRHGLLEPTIRHPIPAEYVDVMIVPGVGFDSCGNRLGRGGGFYDRYLEVSRPPVVIGVAFDEQILDALPIESHDQKMNAVVTPSTTLLN